MGEQEEARFDVVGHASVVGRGACAYGHIRSGQFSAGMLVWSDSWPLDAPVGLLTISHIEFMDRLSTHESYVAIFFQDGADLEWLRSVVPVGAHVQGYNRADPEWQRRSNLRVAVRLAKTQVAIHAEPDPRIRALLQPMADEDAVTLGQPTLTVEAHRAEAQRFLAQVEELARRDHDAAKAAVRQAAAHAFWAEDLALMRDACHAYDRLRIHDDDYYPSMSHPDDHLEEPSTEDRASSPTTEQIMETLEPTRGRWEIVRAAAKAKWAFVRSFLKKDWTLEDYPIEFHCRSVEGIPKSEGWLAKPWKAWITHWNMWGFGETKEDAYQDLKRTFLKRREDGLPLPRPGCGMPLAMAPAHELARYEDVARDFLARILDRSYDNVLLTDQSSLWLFADDQEETIAKIRAVYGVDVSDITDGNLVRIFQRIAARS